MKVKTFGSLPFPHDQEFKNVYNLFKDLEINIVNSKEFLVALSKLDDDNWTSLCMVKYILGEYEFDERFKTREGIWSLEIGETMDSKPCSRIITMKMILKELHLNDELKTRLRHIM